MSELSVMQNLSHHLGSRVLEGGLQHIRGPPVWTDPGAVSSCPLNQSAHSSLIETGPDQSSDVAFGSPSVSGTAFGAAEDLDRAPLRRRTRSAVSKRLTKRPQSGSRSLQCQRFTSVGGATLTQSTRAPWSAELLAA